MGGELPQYNWPRNPNQNFVEKYEPIKPQRIDVAFNDIDLKKISDDWIKKADYQPVIDIFQEGLSTVEFNVLMHILKAITGKSQEQIIQDNEASNVQRLHNDNHPGKFLIAYKGVVQGLCYMNDSLELAGQSKIEMFFDPQRKTF